MLRKLRRSIPAADCEIEDKFFERVEGTVKSHRQLLRHFFCSKKKKEIESSDEEKDE
jgi:hypothetical protein